MVRATNPEQVRVDIGNPLVGQPDEVKYAMAGLAYIAGALISVGYDEVITKDGITGFEFLQERINRGLTDGVIWQRLEATHPTIRQLVADTDRYAKLFSFDGYLGRLGCLDHLYEITPVGDNRGHYELNIYGYD